MLHAKGRCRHVGGGVSSPDPGSGGGAGAFFWIATVSDSSRLIQRQGIISEARHH